MSNPWTPGPWEAKYDGFYCCWVAAPAGKPEGGGNWAEVAKCDFDEEVDEANARLIASAPALVEALEACLGLLTGNMDGDLPADRDPVEMARAALSLAKGTQGETR